jgi:hypothetical protein
MQDRIVVISLVDSEITLYLSLDSALDENSVRCGHVCVCSGKRLSAQQIFEVGKVLVAAKSRVNTAPTNQAVLRVESITYQNPFCKPWQYRKNVF